MSRMCVALLACAAVAAGCGDEDDPASPASGASAGGQAEQRLTKEKWIERADAICVETEDAQAEISDSLAELRSRSYRGLLRKYVRVLRKGVAETRDGFDRLRALKPPAADELQVAEWLSAVDQMLGTYDDVVVALRDAKRARLVKAIREGERIDGEQEVLADLLGLVDCRNVFS